MTQNNFYDPVGNILILHSVAFPYSTNKHEDKFVKVEVVETKEVRCVWQQEKTELGWKALGEDGRIYTNCWSAFPDDSMSPRWLWNLKGGNEEWFDICQGMFEPIPFRPSFMDKYGDILHYCPAHGELNYLKQGKARSEIMKQENTESPCFSCLTKRPANLHVNWKGWR